MRVRGHRLHFEKLCREAGKTTDECFECVVENLGNMWTVDTSHPNYPRKTPLGLGDMVASGLSAVGITKERVGKLVGGDCGCPKRQEALNALGRRLGIGR